MSVSIITPALNAELTLSATIESIRSQSFSDWELLIVDDGSTDHTLRVATDWARADSRIRVIPQRNRGVAEARNVGLSFARRRYLAFLDSDDLWLPEKLDRQLQFMKSKGAAFSYTGYRKFWTDPQRVGPVVNVPSTVDYKTLLRSRPIACPTVIVDRDLVGEVKMPHLPAGSGIPEDLVTWLGILRRGLIAYGLNEDLARYRVAKGSRSYGKLKAAQNVWKVYREHENLGIPAAAWYFSNYVIRAFVESRL